MSKEKKVNKYKDLKIWDKAMELVELVYKLVKELPEDEKFGLTSQIKRCSISISSNIAEGAGRNSKKEFIHFLSIANGSTLELETQLLLTTSLHFVKEEKVQSLLILTNGIKKMNDALRKSIGFA
ncbi:MAG: four helix bundle protein [Bacteroidota bacterium]